MAGDLVLITGVTGHIGFRVLRYALDYGYQVRAVVRSEEKAKTVASNHALKAMNKETQLSFVTVPDLLALGAFDEVVKGVKYIIHLASPMPSEGDDRDFEDKYIQPAVRGTLSIFEAAAKQPSVKRIVVTSSSVALVPLNTLFEHVDTVFDASSRVPEIPAPYQVDFVAYSASKVAALNRAEAWVKETKPAFDVIHIHPSFVEGRNDLTLNTADFQQGTNAILINIILGKASPTSLPASFVHVDDTARVHVLALDLKVDGNQSFITSTAGGDGVAWEDAKKYVAKHFPDAIKRGLLPNNGTAPSTTFKFDVSKTEETFGFKPKSYEEMVVSVVGHYLELLEQEQQELKN